VSFWNVASTLQEKLNTLEARLETIRAHYNISTMRKKEVGDGREPEVSLRTFSQNDERATAGPPGVPPALEQAGPITGTGNSLLGVLPESPWTFTQQDFTDCTLITNGSLDYLGFDLDELLTYG